MSENEAKQFLVAWQNYLRHLSVTATQKTVDLVTAVGVTMFIYVPRGMALSERRRRGHNPPMREAPQGPAQVFRFTPPPMGPQPTQTPNTHATEPEIVEGVAEPVH